MTLRWWASRVARRTSGACSAGSTDGPGRLGVFLRYAPKDFGLAAPPMAPYADARLRAALGDDLACSKESPYNLVWMHAALKPGLDARGSDLHLPPFV